MVFFCEHGAVINLGENRFALRTPILPPEKPYITSLSVGVLVDNVNLTPRTFAFVPVGTDKAPCVEVQLLGSVHLLLARGIGVARVATRLQDGRVMVLVTNFDTNRNTLQKVPSCATSMNSGTQQK